MPAAFVFFFPPCFASRRFKTSRSLVSNSCPQQSVQRLVRQLLRLPDLPLPHHPYHLSTQSSFASHAASLPQLLVCCVANSSLLLNLPPHIFMCCVTALPVHGIRFGGCATSWSPVSLHRIACLKSSDIPVQKKPNPHHNHRCLRISIWLPPLSCPLYREPVYVP